MWKQLPLRLYETHPTSHAGWGVSPALDTVQDLQSQGHLDNI